MREAGCSHPGRPQRRGRRDQIRLRGDRHRASRRASRRTPGARAGDALVFTKRIGTGVIGTALKRGIAREERRGGGDRVDAHAESARLRGDAALRRPRLHRRHRLRPARARARDGAGQRRHRWRSRSTRVQFLPGALEYARPGAIPGGLKNNREFASCAVERAASNSRAKSRTCCTTRRPPAAC